MKTKVPCGIEVEFGNAGFLEILNRYGPTGFNNFIEALHKQKLTYPSYDIRFNFPILQVEFYLEDIDLSNRDLDGLDLTLVYVSKGNFRDSSLYGAKFLIAKNCDFIGCDLRTSMFTSCDISGCLFIDAMLDGINWNRTYYYTGMPPIGLPKEIMSGLQQLEPDNCEGAETTQIPCLAEVKDASYWVH